MFKIITIVILFTSVVKSQGQDLKVSPSIYNDGYGINYDELNDFYLSFGGEEQQSIHFFKITDSSRLQGRIVNWKHKTLTGDRGFTYYTSVEFDSLTIVRASPLVNSINFMFKAYLSTHIDTFRFHPLITPDSVARVNFKLNDKQYYSSDPFLYELLASQKLKGYLQGLREIIQTKRSKQKFGNLLLTTNSKNYYNEILPEIFTLEKNKSHDSLYKLDGDSSYHYFLEYKNKNQIVKLFQKSPTDTLKGVIINWIYQYSKNDTENILYSVLDIPHTKTLQVKSFLNSDSIHTIHNKDTISWIGCCLGCYHYQFNQIIDGKNYSCHLSSRHYYQDSIIAIKTLKHTISQINKELHLDLLNKGFEYQLPTGNYFHVKGQGMIKVNNRYNNYAKTRNKLIGLYGSTKMPYGFFFQKYFKKNLYSRLSYNTDFNKSHDINIYLIKTFRIKDSVGRNKHTFKICYDFRFRELRFKDQHKTFNNKISFRSPSAKGLSFNAGIDFQTQNTTDLGGYIKFNWWHKKWYTLLELENSIFSELYNYRIRISKVFKIKQRFFIASTSYEHFQNYTDIYFSISINL